MPDLAQRFTNLSVGCEPPTRLSGPVFANPMMPAMSHTYINQYTGSDYNLDKQMVKFISFFASRTFLKLFLQDSFLPMTNFFVLLLFKKNDDHSSKCCLAKFTIDHEKFSSASSRICARY
jgi:hypothetical protein